MSDLATFLFRSYSERVPVMPDNQDAWGLAASATGPDYKELLGRLLVFLPHKFEKDVKTENGYKNAVVADVYVIDVKGKRVETHLRQTMIFPAVLVSQLKNNVGKFTPGKLVQGKQKLGEDGAPMRDDSGKEFAAPWEIADPDGVELMVARDAVQSFGRK